MKKVLISVCCLVLMLVSIEAGDTPLVDVAQEELDDSKRYMQFEKHQKNKLYDYVRLLKNRYVLTRELVWQSEKVSEAIYLQSALIRLGE